MKKLLLFAALAACVALTSSCDLFRTLAGRPTSADIANKQLLIAQLERERAAKADTTALPSVDPASAEAPVQDVPAQGVKPAAEPGLTTCAKVDLPYRYYIIIGTFSMKENAEKLGSKLAADGYPVTLITYQNGSTAVGLCASDDLDEINASMKKAQAAGVCSKDSWIIDNA